MPFHLPFPFHQSINININLLTFVFILLSLKYLRLSSFHCKLFFASFFGDAFQKLPTWYHPFLIYSSSTSSHSRRAFFISFFSALTSAFFSPFSFDPIVLWVNISLSTRVPLPISSVDFPLKRLKPSSTPLSSDWYAFFGWNSSNSVQRRTR